MFLRCRSILCHCWSRSHVDASLQQEHINNRSWTTKCSNYHKIGYQIPLWALKTIHIQKVGRCGRRHGFPLTLLTPNPTTPSFASSEYSPTHRRWSMADDQLCHDSKIAAHLLPISSLPSTALLNSSSHQGFVLITSIIISSAIPMPGGLPEPAVTAMQKLMLRRMFCTRPSQWCVGASSRKRAVREESGSECRMWICKRLAWMPSNADQTIVAIDQ